MNLRTSFALVSFAVVAGSAQAQLIQPVAQQRTLQAIASVTDMSGQTTTDQQLDNAPGFGRYDLELNATQTLPSSQATASASAAQTSTIEPNAIVAAGSFVALPEAFAPGRSAEASGSSFLSVTFDLAIPTTFALTGEINQTAGAAVVTLFEGTSTIVQVVSFDGTVPVSEAGALAPGQYRLQIQNAGIAEAGFQSPGETSGSYSVRLAIATAVPSFCDANDGALSACPCGNPGNPDSGCDIAQGTGGVRLELIAQATAPSNSAVLRGTGYPPNGTPASVLIRSSSLEAGGPVVFGDGVRCVASPVVRFGAAFAVNGVSTHSIGHGEAPGDYSYQLWFRNGPSSFCDPASAFNLSNGQTLTW